MKTYLKAFVAGFIATLIFHQGLIGILYLMGAFPFPPYNTSATEPLGVPSVISLSFFAGLWGMLLWRIVSTDTGTKFWLKSFIFGAIGPTAVAFLVVFPIKGIPVQAAMIPFGLFLNGVWGLGTSLLMLGIPARLSGKFNPRQPGN